MPTLKERAREAYKNQAQRSSDEAKRERQANIKRWQEKGYPQFIGKVKKEFRNSFHADLEVLQIKNVDPESPDPISSGFITVEAKSDNLLFVYTTFNKAKYRYNLPDYLMREKEATSTKLHFFLISPEFPEYDSRGFLPTHTKAYPVKDLESLGAYIRVAEDDLERAQEEEKEEVAEKILLFGRNL